MDFTNQENIITQSRIERERLEKITTKNADSPFHRMAINYGLLGGALMGIFLAFGGFYITGDQASFGFAKYLILAVVLGVLLNKVKIASPEGNTFKDGITFGFITTIVAAITTAVITLIVNGTGEAVTIQPYFNTSSGAVLGSFVLAGIVFFEGLVAGLILTFIWLQLLKDRKPAV
jgi:integral membrane sensor domain MASE1